MRYNPIQVGLSSISALVTRDVLGAQDRLLFGLGHSQDWIKGRRRRCWLLDRLERQAFISLASINAVAIMFKIARVLRCRSVSLVCRHDRVPGSTVTSSIQILVLLRVVTFLLDVALERVDVHSVVDSRFD